MGSGKERMTAGSNDFESDRHAFRYGQTIILSDYMTWAKQGNVNRHDADVNDFNRKILTHGHGTASCYQDARDQQVFANPVLVPAYELVLQFPDLQVPSSRHTATRLAYP